MSGVTVVGAGASAVHFALTLLEKGREVRMIDVGHAAPPAPLPEASLLELKERLEEPRDYFLGSTLEAAVLPDNEAEIYGFPPGKAYTFRAPAGFDFGADGFDPLFSFAAGGLAEVWTAGCYPFLPAETADFPFAWEDLSAGYDEVARRIGISGALDDLARFYPEHDGLQPPHELDEHSARLVARYTAKRRWLNEKLGCYLGRTRVAVLSRPLGDRPACANLGRCLWGCPNRAFYTPSLTLEACRHYPNFTYEPGIRVLRFEATGGRVSGLVGRRADGAEVRMPVEHLVLGAGALSSAEIYLRSLAAGAGGTVAGEAAGGSEAGGARTGPLELDGLMDNRQVLVPFVHLGMVGRPYEPRSYQYHLLGLGLEGDDPKSYVHCQITTLKTALVHPVIQRLPFDLAHASRMVALLHSALGVVNVNFHDTRRSENRVRWNPALGDAGGLEIEYRPPADEEARLRPCLARLRRALRALGCVAPRGMMHVRPMGSSVHYAGLLPMSAERGDRGGRAGARTEGDASPTGGRLGGRDRTTTPTGRSRRFANLHFVDGVTFPFLPAKNLTFTLMANAVRIARADF